MELSTFLKDEPVLKSDIKWKNIYSTNLHLTYAIVFSKSVSEKFFQQLEKEVEYYSREITKVKIYGKWCNIPRKQVAYGDHGIKYEFSGTSIPSKSWTPTVLKLKKYVELLTGQTYNFVLINRYANGKDYIGEHRDNERDLDTKAPIASLSLGQERKFRLRHKNCRTIFSTKDISPIKMNLESGSLLVMKYPTNEFWYHSLPVQKNAFGVRINLTFRKILT